MMASYRLTPAQLCILSLLSDEGSKSLEEIAAATDKQLYAVSTSCLVMRDKGYLVPWINYRDDRSISTLGEKALRHARAMANVSVKKNVPKPEKKSAAENAEDILQTCVDALEALYGDAGLPVLLVAWLPSRNYITNVDSLETLGKLGAAMAHDAADAIKSSPPCGYGA